MAIFFQIRLASFLVSLAASPFLPVVQLLLALLIIYSYSISTLPKENRSYWTKLHPQLHLVERVHAACLGYPFLYYYRYIVRGVTFSSICTCSCRYLGVVYYGQHTLYVLMSYYVEWLHHLCLGVASPTMCTFDLCYYYDKCNKKLIGQTQCTLPTFYFKQYCRKIIYLAVVIPITFVHALYIPFMVLPSLLTFEVY